VKLYSLHVDRLWVNWEVFIAYAFFMILLWDCFCLTVNFIAFLLANLNTKCQQQQNGWFTVQQQQNGWFTVLLYKQILKLLCQIQWIQAYLCVAMSSFMVYEEVCCIETSYVFPHMYLSTLDGHMIRHCTGWDYNWVIHCKPSLNRIVASFLMCSVLFECKSMVHLLHTLGLW